MKYFPALGHENGAHDEEGDHVQGTPEGLEGLSFTLFLMFHGADILADRSHRNNGGSKVEVAKTGYCGDCTYPELTDDRVNLRIY